MRCSDRGTRKDWKTKDGGTINLQGSIHNGKKDVHTVS